MRSVRNGRHSLAFGLFLIVLGGIFLLDQFDIASVHLLVRKFWPMILVFFGVSRLFEPRHVGSALWMIIAGLWMQVSVLHIWGLTFTTSWPLLLIGLGASIILRTVVEAATRRVDSAGAGRE